MMLVHIEDVGWVNPNDVAAVLPKDSGSSYIYFSGGQGHFVPAASEAIVARLEEAARQVAEDGEVSQ